MKCKVVEFGHAVLSQVGIQLKLSSYNLFTFNPGYYHFNFLWFS